MEEPAPDQSGATPSGPDLPDDLARELRQTVGAELRAEAEISERETEIMRRRHRTLSELVREAAARGDRVSVVSATRTVTGDVAHVGRDYLTLTSDTEVVDARLEAVLIAPHPSRQGGSRTSGGSITFKARLSEYEQTREPVTIVTSRGGTSTEAGIDGVLEVVAEDHVILSDRDGTSLAVPLGAIDLVLRPRPDRR